ncbi:MAG TPA: hypothetical protein VD866_13655, partial [Urbifossiella sp.]|nr:hypothetical protein [Urbifossiella sp.]
MLFGQAFLMVALTAASAAVVLRARNHTSRTARLGTLAAACGVAAFVPALLGPAFREPSETASLAACGVVTIVLAVASLGLAAWAVGARRREPDARFPVLGFILGPINLFCGAGLLVTGIGVLTPAAGTPRAWRSEEHGLEVTIPTEGWVQRENVNVLAEFRCPRPVIVAAVAEVRPATDAHFDAAVEGGKRKWATERMSNADEQTGPNRHGRPHWRKMGDGRNGEKDYFFGVSLTHANGKVVILMFEGPYRMTSEAGRAQEAHALRTQAELFLGS